VKAISKPPTKKGENAMTRSILNFAATVFAAILPFTAAATMQAQSPQALGTVTVPFAFEAGSAHLQPGTYTISLLNQHVMLVRGTSDLNSSAISMARWNEDGKSSASSKVVFHHYGDKYFLREVWDQSMARHLENSQTPAETKMKKARALNVASNDSLAPVNVVVASSLN
jgi:hypothetical protein